MNIIICGAGKVGFSISKALSAQGHSVTVVDQSSDDIKNINESISFKISSKSKLIKGVFLGLGINGGLKIKNKNDIIEYFSIESFSFPKDDIK